MIPTTVQDNFFDRPDELVRLADSLEFTPAEEQQYPGARSAPFSVIDRDLDRYIGQRILRSWFHAGEFSRTTDLNWVADIRFQIVEPAHEEQYHLKNRGWAHYDSSIKFGGIIYLNPDPEPGTGTDILQTKNQFNEHNAKAASAPGEIEKLEILNANIDAEKISIDIIIKDQNLNETIKQIEIFQNLGKFQEFTDIDDFKMKSSIR